VSRLVVTGGSLTEKIPSLSSGQGTLTNKYASTNKVIVC